MKTRMKIKPFIPWIIACVLGVLLLWSLNVDSGEPTVVEKHTTDTITVIKHDTTVIEKIAYKEKREVDTVWITVRDSIFVPVPISEYRFKEDGLFDITARGFDVSLSNVTVYPKTEYRTITEIKETTVTKYKSSLFVNAHLERFSDTFIPSLGVSLSLNGKWIVGAKIGLFENKPLYGCYAGYNILNK